MTQPDIPAEQAATDSPGQPATHPAGAAHQELPQPQQPWAPPAQQPWAPPAYPAADGDSLAPPSWAPADSPPTQPFTRPPAWAYPAQPAPPPQWPAQPPPAQTSPAPPSPGPPPTRRRAPGGARFWLTVAAAVLGMAGLVASAGGLAAQILPRRFSPAQQRQIMAWETASRWRSWPAGKIFPASVSYQLPGAEFGAATGLTLEAHRVGIAPQSGCAAATDQALARVLGARGCEAVLRATYIDATDSFVVTVGVAVMRGPAPPPVSLPGASPTHGLRPAVKAVPFPGTLASQFGDRQRQLSGAYRSGPYLVMYAAGYTDGRRWDQVSLNPYAATEMGSLGAGVAQHVGAALGAPPPVPRCPGAPGC